jgi:hypothetical protein
MGEIERAGNDVTARIDNDAGRRSLAAEHCLASPAADHFQTADGANLHDGRRHPGDRGLGGLFEGVVKVGGLGVDGGGTYEHNSK